MSVARMFGIMIQPVNSSQGDIKYGLKDNFGGHIMYLRSLNDACEWLFSQPLILKDIDVIMFGVNIGGIVFDAPVAYEIFKGAERPTEKRNVKAITLSLFTEVFSNVVLGTGQIKSHDWWAGIDCEEEDNDG